MEKTHLCSTCRYINCVLVPPIKVKNADLLVIGEAPGDEEERAGIPFCGQSGQVLRNTMRDIGFDMAKVAITNTCLCHPPKNETPKKKDIETCSRQFLFQLIQELQPKMIMCAGAVARSAIEEDMWQKIPVAHVLHPAALLYEPGNEGKFRTGIRKVHNALYPVKYDRELIVVTTTEGLTKLREWIKRKTQVATDIETNNTLDPFNKNGRITHIAFGDGKKAYSIWLDKPNDPVFTEQAAGFVKEVLADSRIEHIFHRSWFDVKFLNSRGFEVAKFTDTRVKAFLLNEDRMELGLKELAAEYIGPYQFTMDKDPIKNGYYNGEDSYFTYKLSEIFDGQMSTPLKKVLNKIVMPVIPVLNEMMLTGIKIDQAQAKKVKKEVEQARDEAQQELLKKYKIFRGINLESPDQMQAVLFGAMKEKPVKETKTGYSVDEETLNTYAYQGKEWARLIVKYRKQNKLLSTYIDKIPKMVNYDGRIRTQFDPANSRAGRLSSSDPNLQNIPRNKEIHKMFVADKGKMLSSFDFSQLELRTAASMAPDAKMLMAFRNGEDVHKQTASLVTGTPITEVTEDQRQLAKGVNFGEVYGQQAEGLKQYLFDKFEIDIELREAERIRKVYFENYGGLLLWHKRVIDEIYRTHQVVYPTGRVRRFPQAKAYDKIPGSILRQGINAPNQGSANDCVSFTMSKLHALIKKAKLPVKFVLTVHDMAMFEQDDDRKVLEYLIELTNMVIKDVLPKDELFSWLKCPLEVSFKFGKSWGEMENL
jgi:DNA polymerase-1